MLILMFIVGLCFGSFANVLIYRLPLKKSIISPPSSCPNCNHQIKWFENIPIISYLFLRGKCSKCGLKISIRYPIVELSIGILFAVLWHFKFSNALTPFEIAQFFITAIFVFLLFVISYIDIEHLIIPDSLSIALFTSAILTKTDYLHNFINGLSSGIFAFAIFYAISVLAEKAFKKEALGGGDIKIALGLGTVLGLQNFFIAVFIASIFSSIIGISLIILKKKQFDLCLPYGPFLAIGTLITYWIF